MVAEEIMSKIKTTQEYIDRIERLEKALKEIHKEAESLQLGVGGLVTTKQNIAVIAKFALMEK
jgi:hypothetical protein